MTLALFIGLIGVGLTMLTFQVNNRSVMLRILAASCLVWVLHYMLIGALTGAGMLLLAAVRSYLFERYRHLDRVLWVMFVALIIATVVTWKNWTSILPLIGMVLATIAVWQKNPRHIRLLSLTYAPFWVTYNLMNGSYPGMAADMIAFTSVLIGIYRFDVLPMLHAKQERTAELAEV